MSYNAINSQTIAAQKRKEARRPKIRFRLPLHIDPCDDSQEADRRRYDLHVAMSRLNPNGFRKIGKRVPGNNRLTELANHAYDKSEAPSVASMVKDAIATTKQLFNINKEIRT